MSEAKTSYCTYRDAHVNTADGMKHCIMDHQCFSDDPCPLHDEFNMQVLNTTKSAGALAANGCAPLPPTRPRSQAG